jgi:hypothetical protein
VNALKQLACLGNSAEFALLALCTRFRGRNCIAIYRKRCEPDSFSIQKALIGSSMTAFRKQPIP